MKPQHAVHHIPKPRAVLSIERAQIADTDKAEKAAVGIYQQVARCPVRVIERASDETRHIFRVEVDQ